MPSFPRLLPSRRLLAGLLFIAAFGAQSAWAQYPTADPGALSFSAANTGPQVVKLTPSQFASFNLKVNPPGAFQIQTDSAACTQAALATGACLLPAGGKPVTLTISFVPTGTRVQAMILMGIAGPVPPGSPLVALSGNGPVPVPNADHGSLNFTANSASQTVKIKPATGQDYQLHMIGTGAAGAGASSFHIDSDSAMCTEALLLAGNCAMPETGNPLTLTVSFLPTGGAVAASIVATSGGVNTPIVALSGSGNKQPPAVDTDSMIFDGSGRQTVTLTPATYAYMLTLTGDGKADYSVSSDIYNCTDLQLNNAGCLLPAAGKAVKPITLTINQKVKNPKSTKLAYLTATNNEDSDDTTPLVTLLEPPAPDGELDCTARYSDCDLRAGISVSLVGGLEQSYLSSEQDETNGFIRFSTQKINQIADTHWSFGPWGVVRDLGAPQTADNQNIVTALSNPDGTLTTSSLASIGYSVDFLVGLAFDHPALGKSGQYSWGPILAIGSTTPLSSTTTNAAYQVPILGTQACAELQQRFTGPQAVSTGYSSQLIPGPTTTLTTACLVNTNANSAGAPSAVNTLAFSGINRSNFLEKWEAGVRTTYRTYTSSIQHSCDVNNNSCQRGTVDYTIGQDSAITRGQMRNWVGKIDGIQPLPYSNGFLYLFGSVALRFAHNVEYPPLILQAATSISNTPSPSTFVEPLFQPNKDFYRIGVGLSLDQIFTTLKKK